MNTHDTTAIQATTVAGTFLIKPSLPNKLGRPDTPGRPRVTIHCRATPAHDTWSSPFGWSPGFRSSYFRAFPAKASGRTCGFVPVTVAGPLRHLTGFPSPKGITLVPNRVKDTIVWGTSQRALFLAGPAVTPGGISPARSIPWGCGVKNPTSLQRPGRKRPVRGNHWRPSLPRKG